MILNKYFFNELYKMDSGISTTKEQAGHGYPFLSFSTIFNNPILPEKLTDLMDTSEEEQEKYSIMAGDIFLTRTSETLDELAMSSVAVKDYPGATFSGFAKRLRPLQSDITYAKFMAFFLRSTYFRKIVDCKAIMTLRASFNEDIYSYIKIVLPEYQHQVKAGDLCFIIEQKIRNNNKIVVELEELAKTLYGYWFLQFNFPNEKGELYKKSAGALRWCKELKREIPVDWKVGTIANLGEIVGGGTPTSTNEDYYCKNGISWITPNDMAKTNNIYITHGSRDITELGLKNSSAILMPPGTVLLTSRAPIGYLGIAANEVCTNQGFKSIIPDKKYGSMFIYYTIQALIPYLKSLGTGSTFTEISKDVLAKVKIALPDDKTLAKFNEKVTLIGEKIKIIEEENQELISLRNYLFPFLMTGQVVFKK